MTKPESLKDKMRNTPFIADHSLMVGYAACKYNAGYKQKVIKRRRGKKA